MKLGDCFEVAGKLITGLDGTDFDPKAWLLVHGTVWHAATGRHWHGWLESVDGRWALDRSNGNDVTMPKAVYRLIGKAENAKEYTPNEAALAMLDHLHFGPWHKDADDPYP